MANNPDFKRFARDEDGSTLIEFTVSLLLFMTLLFGIVDFTYAYFQWNAATKATQLGARIAAVSDPVAGGLRTWTGVAGSVLPGDAMPTFDVTCESSGGTASCTGSPGAAIGTASTAAFNAIVYGRGNGAACPATPATSLNTGMCNLFGRITPDRVRIRYQNTGLGFAGRPGGAVPTVTVSLRNVTFDYVFLGGLMNFAQVAMPNFATTVTGEDLNVAAPP
jgi:TadE-like protein